MSNKRDSFERLFNWVLPALGFFIMLFATEKFGPGVSPDSISYVAAARSLASGGGYFNYDGTPFVLWPPLFPTILAGGVALGIDVLQFARFFNALTFGLIIFCFGHMASRLIDSRVLRGISTASALLSFPLLKMSVMLWSEPLLILLVLIFLMRLGQIRASGSLSFGAVAVLAGVAALACLQRYLGIVLVVCGAAFLLCRYRARWREGLIQVSAFSVLSLAPLALWIFRNHALAGEVAGPRMPSSASVTMSLRDFLTVWTNWFVPFDSAMPVRLAAFVLVTGLVVFFVFISPGELDRGDPAARNGIIFGGGAFVLSYSLALLIITSTVGLEPISQRYLSPVFPIFLLLAFKAIEEFARWCETRGAYAKLASILLLAPPLIILSHSALTAFQVVSIWREEGTGDYTHVKWQRSELLPWLAQNPLAGEVYSNAADLIYLKTGVIAHALPSRGTDLTSWRGQLLPGKKYYGAWFAHSFRTYLPTPAEVSSAFQLAPVFLRETEVLFELK